VHLGVDEKTEPAWQAAQHRWLGLLDAHFHRHDYVLGGAPSLADYGLLAPLYAHLYRDAVPGFALRVFFPVLAEWVERTNGEGALNARVKGQSLYSLDEGGTLVRRPDGYWLEPNPNRDAVQLNGRPLSRPTQLSTGDRVTLGPLEVQFQIER